MRLDFFPSRTLTLYLAKMFAIRIVAVLAMLVLVLLMLDLLSSSGDILAAPGNGQSELLTYAGLRAPQLASRFLPYAVLLATIIALVTLNQNSEVIAMKAAGLSAHQVLAPLLLTAAVVAGLSFVFNERVTTSATATLSAWEANEFGAVPTEPDQRANVYLAVGNDVLSAASIGGTGADTVMRGVTFYRRGPGGIITQQLRAPRAVWAAPGWRLEDVTRFDVASARAERLPAVTVAPDLSPEQVALRSADPDTLSFGQLGETITRFGEAGRRTAELEATRWHRLSGPLSAVLMPLLGAIAAFGLARSGQLFVRAIIAMALGFAYFVVDNAALALGSFGGYPPFLAAWSPFFLFLLIGETVLIRTEE